MQLSRGPQTRFAIPAQGHSETHPHLVGSILFGIFLGVRVVRTSVMWVMPVAVILGGCVVTPGPTVVPQPTSAPVGMGFEDQYSPPLEYVEGGAPIFYDTEPGVAYYPILLDTPGSCFCIVPMRYVNGVWLGVGGVVLYRGYFRFHYPTQHHRDVWVRSGGVINGYAPMRGSVERVGNVVRPVPPPGSIHAQQLDRQRAYREQGAQPRQPPNWQQANQPQRAPEGPQPMQPRQAPNWQQANQPQRAPDGPQPMQPRQAPNWQQANQPQRAPEGPQAIQPQQAPNWQQANQPQRSPDGSQPMQSRQAPNWQQANQPQRAPDGQQAIQPRQAPTWQQANQPQQAPNRQQTMQPQHTFDRSQPFQPQQAPNRQQTMPSQHAPDRPQPIQPPQAPQRQQANQPQKTPGQPQANQPQQRKRQDEEKGTH